MKKGKLEGLLFVYTENGRKNRKVDESKNDGFIMKKGKLEALLFVCKQRGRERGRGKGGKIEEGVDRW